MSKIPDYKPVWTRPLDKAQAEMFKLHAKGEFSMTDLLNFVTKVSTICDEVPERFFNYFSRTK